MSKTPTVIGIIDQLQVAGGGMTLLDLANRIYNAFTAVLRWLADEPEPVGSGRL